MDKMELKALAKLNLGLDILGRRENGYHDLRMIMQTIYLYDQIILEKKDEPGIELDLNLKFLPTDEKNLAYKAAKLMMDEFQLPGGVKIKLNKHIPVAAGMAGGSSNAASVLFGMNRLYGLGLSEEELRERGVTLGADVPYCIMRGTALAEGIGEVLTPLPPLPKCFVLIAKPPISASTVAVYQLYDELEHVDHPNIDRLIEGLKEGDLQKVVGSMGNVLEQVMIPRHPEIGKIKEIMLEEGAMGAMMSGSGPTVFGIFETRADAKRAAEAVRKSKLAKQIYVTNIHNSRR